MPLIKDGEFVEDGWVRIEDDAPLPGDRDVILSLDRLKTESAAVSGRNGRTGVALPNSADPDELAPFLSSLDLVVLAFPAFTDGRAYSQARQLRTKLGFTKELRATGDVLVDQASFMQQVGFDTFEVSGHQPLETWLEALEAMSLTYQRGYAGGANTRYSSTQGARTEQ